jgi:hypothetical protein
MKMKMKRKLKRNGVCNDDYAVEASITTATLAAAITLNF